MKIVLVFPGCHRRGGVERVVFECADFLAGRGYEVDVYSNEWEESTNKVIRYHYVPMQKYPFFIRPLSFFKESNRLLSNKRYDVLCTFGPDCPLGGVIWVFSIEKAWLERSQILRPRLSLERIKQYINPFHPILLWLMYRHFQHRSYRKIIAVTEQVRADLVRIYEIPNKDIAVIPIGFSPQEFNVKKRYELRSITRQNLGYRKEDKVIIFPVNEVRRKGLGTLLRAVASLSNPDLYILMTGRESPFLYNNLMRQLGLLRHVKYVGSVGDIAPYYSAADVLALPTQYEPWGLVIIEALASGLPVLTSRLAGASIAVREGETGFLIDDPLDTREIASKLKLIFEKEKVAPEKISDSVMAFSWDNVLPEYEKVLTEGFNYK